MSAPADFLNKVTAFVTRSGPTGPELLLFNHPHAGIQIPAGTVEEDEWLEVAALREVAEETGLTNLNVVSYIGSRDELPPGFTNVILRKTKVYSRPNTTSFDWAEFRRGIPVRLLRRAPGFALVTYEEGDRYPDPTYLTYAITGWVPENTLAQANRRHFFHLELEGSAPETGPLFADHHVFRPFWALLSHLPEIIPPQRAWLDFVTKDLGYSFEEKSRS